MFAWIETAVEALAWGISLMIMTVGLFAIIKVGLTLFRKKE